MKRKSKLVFSLCLVFVMLFGSVISVNAAKVTSDKHSAGSLVSNWHIVVREATEGFDCVTYKFNNEITSGSDIRSLMFKYCDDDGDGYCGTLLLSKESFKYNYSYGSSSVYGVDVPVDPSTLTGSENGVYSRSSNSLVYNDVTYYYAVSGYSFSSPYILHQTGAFCVDINDYVDGLWTDNSVKGAFFEKCYLADFTWSDGSFDYSSAVQNTNLGYLENLSVDTAFTTDGTQMKVMVSWDNNHENWDDSYRVAHYVRFRAVKNGVTGATDLDVAPSELVLINDVPFSSCYSSYTNTTEAYRSAYDSYFDSVKSQLSGFTLNLALVCDEYLIIYHENEYGYWNVLRNNDEDLWDNWSYGVLDSNGNYTPVEDFGEIDKDVGIGDTLEDAENNLQNRPVTDGSDASEFGDNLVDMLNSLVGSVGQLPQIIGNFFQFLPSEIVGMIALGLAMILVLRILGR